MDGVLNSDSHVPSDSHDQLEKLLLCTPRTRKVEDAYYRGSDITIGMHASTRGPPYLTKPRIGVMLFGKNAVAVKQSSGTHFPPSFASL
jgi:hypothetical protein